MCAEKEDEERHLHGQVWMEKPRTKGDFTKALKRVQERCDPQWSSASGKVLSGGVKIAYSKDWIEEYLTKEDKWILNNPPDYEEDYYPSKEEQDKVKNDANAVDKKFHKWKEDYKEWIKANPLDAGSFDGNCVVRHTHCAKFLADMMFNTKKYCVIVDAKARKQNCDALFHYIYPSFNSYKLFLTEENIENYEDIKKCYLETPEDH